MVILLVVQQAVLQSLIRTMVSLGGLSSDEMVAVLDQAERDAAPFVPNQRYAQQTFATLRRTAVDAAPKEVAPRPAALRPAGAAARRRPTDVVRRAPPKPPPP